MFVYPIIIVIGGILVLFIYTTRLASKEIFLPSNKIQSEVGRAKELSTPRYNEAFEVHLFRIPARLYKSSGSYHTAV